MELFTFEEWCEHFKISPEKNKLTTFCYERDRRIGEVIVNEGLDGVIRLLKSYPHQMADVASLIIHIYELLKSKGRI